MDRSHGAGSVSAASYQQSERLPPPRQPPAYFRGRRRAAALIRLLVLIPAVVHLERPVLLGIHANPFTIAVLVHVGDERIGRIVLLAAAHREVQLPYIRRSRRVVDGLPDLRRPALPRAVVH